MFSPRHATSREWFRSGFFAALGVVVLGVLALLVWQFSVAVVVIAAPFVVGLMLALLLDPLADRLERQGLPRLGAVGIVFGIFLLLLVGFFWAVVPALINEAGQFRNNSPGAVQNLKVTVTDWLTAHKNVRLGGARMPKNFDTLSARLLAGGTEYLEKSTGGIQGFLTGTVTTIISTVITLIVAFFLLKDIDKLRARLFYLMPERVRAPLGQVGRDIGGVFYDYLRGLLIVCTAYGFCTIIMLYALSLTHGHGELANYALLVGTASGVLYAVPYLGSLTTALITFVVAFAAGGIGFGAEAIVMLLVINQIFDNIVTPRVVGGGVGLHPVLAIFALIIGGEIFHIWGMLLSVPIAASIQVILFRIFPRLAMPTPTTFLLEHGAAIDRSSPNGETSKAVEGAHPKVPEGPSQLNANPRP